METSAVAGDHIRLRLNWNWHQGDLSSTWRSILSQYLSLLSKTSSINHAVIDSNSSSLFCALNHDITQQPRPPQIRDTWFQPSKAHFTGKGDPFHLELGVSAFLEAALGIEVGLSPSLFTPRQPYFSSRDICTDLTPDIAAS